MSAYLREVRSRLPGAAVSVVAALATFAAAWWATPTLLGPAAEQEPVVSPIDQLYAEHECAPTAGPGRSLLLVDTLDGGPQLVDAATTQDGLRVQTDWLYDQRADFYGYCRPTEPASP